MKKKKNAREKRVLIGAVAVAGVMVAGSTFAWFTSKDEVTNRLTASADYGVSVVEDFAPPKDLTPGQEVEKDVAVVNTGNIDAFVKVALKNELTLTTLEGKALTIEAPTTAGTTTWNIALPTGSNKYVELATADSADTNTGELTTNEVSTLQAGGILVFNGDEAVAVKDQFVCAGDMGTGDTDTDFNGARQFKPTKTGLYLFKRNNGDGTSTTPEYSGYYYVAASGTDTEKYYALETKTGADLDLTTGKATAITPYVKGTITLGTTESTDKDVVTGISDIKVLTKTTNENVATTYTLGKLATNATTGAHEFTENTTATIDKSTVTHIKVANSATNPVTFYIALDANWSDNWTYLAPSGDAATDGVVDNFLYNDTLKAGTTSKKLVDSVVMDNTVTQAAFNELTYDLSVLMDSIQVTKNSEGDDLLTETGWGVTATANNSSAISVNGVAEKIDGLTWANSN